ncbi:unnamed protein product [Linum tenue]|uniref:Transmembrane protein n=1 Tax=Linum tenue TaxID=586396 RepID=A0AAV0K868_9ROSI|nr:unnamed protein product [Linum tenue]
MAANFLHFLPQKSPISIAHHRATPPLTTKQFTQISFPRRHRQNAINGDETPQQLPPTVTPPPETVEVRFRRRSKRRGRQRGEDGGGAKGAAARPPAPKKKWEEMSMGEKALELYVGEKGALFWLNKFAYASIFIVIGGWIVFRFVGPALNLYQLDAPPLPPSAVFKG